jgi:AraC-like DNA-binding protein
MRTIAIQRSNSGRWSMESGAPAPVLRSFVAGNYNGWAEWVTPAVRRRELPVLFVPLILNFGAGWKVSGDDGCSSPSLSSFAAGAHDRSVFVEAQGHACCLQVNLTFAAAYRLFRLPMHELVNQSLRLDDLLGRKGAALIEDLGNAADWPERFDLLDAFLLDNLYDSRGLSPEVDFAFGRIASTQGNEAISALSDETGWSRKKLIAGFRQQIGLPPKTIARICRFDHAQRRLRQGAGSLASIALDCGYYDQAHFNRDFLAFAGVTPTSFLAEHAETALAA